MAPEQPDLELVVALGRAFVARGMPRHAQLLRAYYRSRTRGGRSAWSDAMVLEWLRLLRIPPHDQHYPVRPRNQPCVTCAAEDRTALAHTQTVFPGGCKMRCTGCKSEWLELDRVE